jgi:hypothetical protein
MKKQTKILKLVLSTQAYTVTGTPQKMFELRLNTPWIRSRLLNKDGTLRRYSMVTFYDGYSKYRNKKTFRNIEIEITPESRSYRFSNGLEFYLPAGGFIIHFKSNTKTN